MNKTIKVLTNSPRVCEMVHSGVITREDGMEYSELKVMRSNAGYYIGTEYHGDGFPQPGSRDSEYFKSREVAQTALTSGVYSQRWAQ